VHNHHVDFFESRRSDHDYATADEIGTTIQWNSTIYEQVLRGNAHFRPIRTVMGIGAVHAFAHAHECKTTGTVPAMGYCPVIHDPALHGHSTVE